MRTVSLTPSKLFWWPPPISKKSRNNQNPFMRNTILIWQRISKYFRLRSLSFTLLISANPSFIPSVTDWAFERRKELGVYNVGDLFIQGTFASFQQNEVKYELPKTDFFNFFFRIDILWIHILENLEGQTRSVPQRMYNRQTSVSFIYNTVQESGQVNMEYRKNDWEKELSSENSS